jgi:hypothetical protein
LPETRIWKKKNLRVINYNHDLQYKDRIRKSVIGIRSCNGQKFTCGTKLVSPFCLGSLGAPMFTMFPLTENVFRATGSVVTSKCSVVN